IFFGELRSPSRTTGAASGESASRRFAAATRSPAHDEPDFVRAFPRGCALALHPSARSCQKTCRFDRVEGLLSMPRCYSRRMLFAAPLLTAPALLAAPRIAAAGDFASFLDAVRREAAAQGIRLSTVDQALNFAQYLPHVIELDRRQPEQIL